MRSAAIRGWMFGGIALGEARADVGEPHGIDLTAAGRIAMVEGDAAIRQSIVMLLTTMPGERVMRSDYGCPLHRLVFAPNDATTAGLAIHYVRQALLRFEPRIEIVSLDARTDRDREASLSISIVYRVKATNRQDGLEFGLNLGGEVG